MNLNAILSIAAALVFGAATFFFGATSDGGQNFAVSFDKAKAVYQCAQTINEQTAISIPAEPPLLTDPEAAKADKVDTAPVVSPTGTSVGPTSMLMPADPEPDPAPAAVFAENRRTAICSSTRFLSGLDGGEGDGNTEPDKA